MVTTCRNWQETRPPPYSPPHTPYSILHTTYYILDSLQTVSFTVQGQAPLHRALLSQTALQLIIQEIFLLHNTKVFVCKVFMNVFLRSIFKDMSCPFQLPVPMKDRTFVCRVNLKNKMYLFINACYLTYCELFVYVILNERNLFFNQNVKTRSSSERTEEQASSSCIPFPLNSCTLKKEECCKVAVDLKKFYSWMLPYIWEG